MFNNLSFQFPKQQVDAATKEKPDWYANSIDYIIGLGLSLNDRTETETMLNVLKRLLILTMQLMNFFNVFLQLFVIMILCLILYVDI